MKLGELAYIRKGLKLPQNLLLTLKPANSNTLSVVSASNFSKNGTIGKFVLEKELRKNNIKYSKRDLLEYGDYFIVIDSLNKCRIFRHDEISGTYLPTDDIIIINGSISILENFLGYEKNRKYLCNDIEKALTEGKKNVLNIISEIVVNTDNIKELDDANEADHIGIRKPIDKEDLLLFNIVQKPIPLDKIIKRIKHDELLLDTEFQRRPGLWDIPTKSRLIEAMIVRLPIPAFYFDGSNDDQWLIIDGLQRVSTVNSFLNNEFQLTGLDYLPELLEGKTFDMLERSFQRNIEEYEIFAYIIQKGTPPAVKYKIFKNINTSALVLEPQEIRHAINPGKPAVLLKDIAGSEFFIKSVPISDRQRDRMYGREIVLRFIALQEFRLEYTPSVVEFLDESMEKLYGIPEHKIPILKNLLEDILAKIISVFGEAPFSRSYFNNSNTYRHNNILFELITYAFSKNSRLVLNKEMTRNKFVDFFSKQPTAFWDTDSAYSKEGLFNRFESIEKLIKDI